MSSPTIEKMKAHAKRRAKRANGAAKRAFVNVWIKMGTLVRDELPMLRGAPLSVLIYLAARMNNRFQCNPSIPLIAKQTGYSIRQVQHSLVYLRELKFIHYEVQDWHYGDGRQPSNTYTLTRRYEVDGKFYPLFEYGRHTRSKTDDGDNATEVS